MNRLVSEIADGTVHKLFLDDAVSVCARMGNIREMILSCKSESENMLFKVRTPCLPCRARSLSTRELPVKCALCWWQPAQRASAHERGVKSLQRYLKLQTVCTCRKRAAWLGLALFRVQSPSVAAAMPTTGSLY